MQCKSYSRRIGNKSDDRISIPMYLHLPQSTCPNKRSMNLQTPILWKHSLHHMMCKKMNWYMLCMSIDKPDKIKKLHHHNILKSINILELNLCLIHMSNNLCLKLHMFYIYSCRQDKFSYFPSCSTYPYIYIPQFHLICDTLLNYSLNMTKMKNQCIIGMYNGRKSRLHSQNQNISNYISKCHFQQPMNDESLLDMMYKNSQCCCMLNKYNCSLLVHSLHLLVMFIHTHQYNCMYPPNCHMFLLMYSLYSLNLNFHCMLSIQHRRVDRFHLHRIRLSNMLIIWQQIKTIKGEKLSA